MDPDARAVEVWDLAAGASEPVTLTGGDRLTWRPEGTEPALEIDLEGLLGDP